VDGERGRPKRKGLIASVAGVGMKTDEVIRLLYTLGIAEKTLYTLKVRVRGQIAKPGELFSANEIPYR